MYTTIPIITVATVMTIIIVGIYIYIYIIIGDICCYDYYWSDYGHMFFVSIIIIDILRLYYCYQLLGDIKILLLALLVS